jgi:hypothetical protein
MTTGHAAIPTILPDHVLNAILTLAKRKSSRDRLAFRGHDYQIQEIFADLAASEHYSVLKPFVFSDSGPEPYSPALNESVTRLQLSGLIGRENPDYAVVFLRPAAERFFDEVIASNLSKEEIQELEEIAEHFLGKITLTP